MTALLHRPAPAAARRPLLRPALAVAAALLAVASLPLRWHVLAVDGVDLVERGRDVPGAALLLLVAAAVTLTAVRRRPPLAALVFGLASTVAVRLGMLLGDLAAGDDLRATGPGYPVLTASAALHALALAVALREAGEHRRARALLVVLGLAAAACAAALATGARAV